MQKPNSPAVQAALAVLDAQPLVEDSSALVIAKCRALLVGFDARYANSPIVPEQTELTVISDLLNPDTGKRSRTWRVAGKIDLIASYMGKRVIVDYKTTSDEISDPAGTFWRVLLIDAQAPHYMLLEWSNGRKCDYAVWNVTRKPQTSPKKLSKAERTLAVSNREYFNRPLSEESLASLQVDERETCEMYESRLLDDCTKERPDWFFQQRTNPRLDSELVEYAKDLWDTGQLILEAKRLNRFQKHPASCLNYGRPCSFLGLCSNMDNPDSDKWARRACVHSEMELDSDGRDTLTHSSIRCWQACPRRYYWRYIVGLERVDEEEAEPLWFGRCYHAALETYNNVLIASLQKTE